MRRQPRTSLRPIQRLAAALPLVLAFAVHTHLAQTHSHLLAGVQVTSESAEQNSPASPLGAVDDRRAQPAPSDPHAVDRSLHQQLLSSDDFLIPTLPEIMPPVQWAGIVVVPLLQPAPTPATESHHWSGRAPPSA